MIRGESQFGTIGSEASFTLEEPPCVEAPQGPDFVFVRDREQRLAQFMVADLVHLEGRPRTAENQRASDRLRDRIALQIRIGGFLEHMLSDEGQYPAAVSAYIEHARDEALRAAELRVQQETSRTLFSMDDFDGSVADLYTQPSAEEASVPRIKTYHKVTLPRTIAHSIVTAVMPTPQSIPGAVRTRFPRHIPVAKQPRMAQDIIEPAA